MAHRTLGTSCVRELLRCWQAGESLRSIARNLGIDRKTVRRYVRVAQAMRLASDAPLAHETVTAIASVVQRRPDSVTEAQHALGSRRARIRGWLAAGLSLRRVHAELVRLGIRTSYATLRRFAIGELGWRRRPAAAVPRAA